ncbi:MAG: NnrS family protein [Phycisphaerales bacterium]|jgi:hypothetical protein|nr:NnrS family protein [Phycisphaerales bacterium]
MVAQGRRVSLNDHVAQTTPPVVQLANAIHRRFFVAAIALVMTFGATWGAWLLWRIGFLGNFTGISVHEINAHGHAQIFGWVGLFMMGIGYQVFARFWQTTLTAPRLVIPVFVAMTAGIVLHTIGQATADQWSAAVPISTVGGVLELAAIITFCVQMLATFRASTKKFSPSVGFIFMALFWFVAMAAMDLWHTHATMTAPTRDRLLWYVSTYQAPLRDMQVHGLAVFMILGVSLQLLPAMYGIRPASPRRNWIALGMLTLAVVGECLIFVAYRWTGLHVMAALLMIPWLMIAIGIAMIVLPWKLWKPFRQTDRSAKFIRIAYLWLAVSLTMLLFLPVYLSISKIPFSHAYYGAIRHAITVGFISLMIMGISARVVPTFNGVNPVGLSSLWGPFVLINVGCFLRVSTQTLTDWHPAFYTIIGISGVLEVISLAWWGAGLISIMHQGKRKLREQAPIRTHPNRFFANQTPEDDSIMSPAISSSLR